MLRLVMYLVVFAAVIYAFFWIVDRRNSKPAPGRRGPGGDAGGRPAPRGPVGPDDDEDFLRELDRRKRHREKHGQDEES